MFDAVKHGSAQAQFLYSKLIMSDDLKVFKKYLQQAESGGCIGAKGLLGYFESISKYAETKKYHIPGRSRDVAEKGDILSQEMIAVLYEKKQDYAKAIKWYTALTDIDHSGYLKFKIASEKALQKIKKIYKDYEIEYNKAKLLKFPRSYEVCQQSEYLNSKGESIIYNLKKEVKKRITHINTYKTLNESISKLTDKPKIIFFIRFDPDQRKMYEEFLENPAMLAIIEKYYVFNVYLEKFTNPQLEKIEKEYYATRGRVNYVDQNNDIHSSFGIYANQRDFIDWIKTGKIK